VAILAYARGDEAPARVGYSIRSSAGPAVIRNRIKRRLRAALGQIQLRPGVDVVISGTRSAAQEEFQILVEKVRSGLQSVGAAS
jgi:ribonuclease P protein component